MKARPLDHLVYEHMFPNPSPQDPHCFQALLQRHLVVEVRHEVTTFYGHLDTAEARYPGLDYANPIHRVRLSRWQWHRRLFRAFDALALTSGEIAALTKWEGTRWAKERYEREHACLIRDTAGDDIPDWVEPTERAGPVLRAQLATDQPFPVLVDAASHLRKAPGPVVQLSSDTEQSDDDEDEDMDTTSGRDRSPAPRRHIGYADGPAGAATSPSPDQRLQGRVARRPDAAAPLDEEWEQWLKSLVETGHGDNTDRFGRPASMLTPEDLFPPRIISAARDGRWDQIPEVLHDIIRQRLADEQSGNPAASRAGSAATWRNLLASEPAGRRAFAELRQPNSVMNGTSSASRTPQTAPTTGA